jgi:hypothetical protein
VKLLVAMSVIDCAFNGEEKTMNRYLQKKKQQRRERERKDEYIYIKQRTFPPHMSLTFSLYI